MYQLTSPSPGLVTQLASPGITPGVGEITVNLTMCGICGTDVMKVFSTGPRPERLGHEVVGVVEQVGTGVTSIKPGQRVAVAHHAPDPQSHYARRGSETMDPAFKRSNLLPGGFATRILVPQNLVPHTVIPIPDHVPDGRAVFMEPLACCIRALDRLSLQQGDHVLLVGIGAVGMLFVPMLQTAGIAVTAHDLRPERIEIATRWGAVPTLPQHGADAVVLSIVTPDTVSHALSAVRDGGSIVLFGGKPGHPLPLPLWEIWTREINIVSSYSATPSSLRRAISHLASPAFAELEELISHRIPLAQGQEAFDLARNGKASKIVITP
jgi:L-iditol 2-dehydrogenase